MDWNEGAGDTSIDDIFNFITNTQGESKKKRSSILKKTYIDFFENDETAGTDYRRNRQSMKRVSFAETFQVKELNTGNIYDIPGWNESSQRSQISSQSISGAESEINKFEDNSTSRLSVPESATVTHQEPTEISRSLNQTSQNNKLDDTVDPCRSDGKGFTAEPSYGILEKSCLEIQYEKEFPSPSIATKTVRELLEGNSNDMELTMHERECVSIYPKPYLVNKERFEVDQNVVYSSVSQWMGAKNPDETSSITYENSFFNGGSQECKSKKEDHLPFVMKSDNFGSEKNSQKKIPFSSNVNESNKNFLHSKETAHSREVDVDISNKENQFQSSPKFQNLKFIDSPPSWKVDKENVLKQLNKAPKTLFENQPNPLEGLGFSRQIKVTKGPDVASLHGQRKGSDFPLEVDKENVYSGIEKKVESDPRILKLVTQAHIPSRSEDAIEFEINKTRHNMSAMDLTLLQERLDEDSDLSYGPELDRYVNPEQSFEDCPLASDKNAGKAVKVIEGDAEKTQNKTRFSCCDMEITCMVDNPMDESSLFPSPPRPGNVCGDDMKKYVAGTEMNLNALEVTESAPNERLKSLQESNPNFSFEEMGGNALSTSTNLFCPLPSINAGKHAYSNDSLLKKDRESAFVNFSLGNEDQQFEAHNFGIAEDGTLKKKEQIGRPPDGAPGRKFLKFSEESQNSRLQTRSPNKESTSESSFILKNKENLHSCRKRTFQSANKPTRMPLGFRRDQLISSNESVSQRIDIANAISTSSEEGALIEHSVSFKEPCSSENSGIGKQTQLFQSEMMEFTCHNSTLEEKDESIEFLSPVVKQVQIVTETKIATPNVVFSTHKYENTRYSVSNYMDLTCLPDSENSPSTLSSFHEAGTEKNKFASAEVELTSNFMTQSQCDTNFSMDGSAFRYVERSSGSIPSRQWSLTYRSSSNNTSLESDENAQQFTSQPMNNFLDQSLFVAAEDCNNVVKKSGQLLLRSKLSSDNTAKHENKTQYFASQPMELTCKTSNFGNENLFAETPKADDSLFREHQVPPYFHLKKLPLSDSANKDTFRFDADRSVNARLFKVTTDRFSSSKPSSCSRKPETVGKTTPNDKSAFSCGLQIGLMNKTSVHDNSVSAALQKDVSVTVNKTIESIDRTNKEIGHKTSYAESAEEKGAISNLKMIQRKPPTNTPGAVYNIRKIKQALKEGASNLVLFPELGEVLKKTQRFSSKHPYTEMKVISPETKDYRKNLSFDPSSQENSFTCSSREGSRLPSIGQLSSRLRRVSREPEVPLVRIDAGVKTFSQDNDISNVILASPEKPQTINVVKGDQSATSPEKHRSLNASKVCHSVLYNQVSSILCEDDSMQLLPHSALENTFLEAASKNYTICLDRSDFVLKEKCSVAAEEPRQLSVSSQSANCMSHGASGEEASSRLPEKLVESYRSPRNDAALGRTCILASPKNNEGVSTKETQLGDLSARQGLSSPVAISFSPNSLREYYTAKLRENDRLFPISSFACEDTVKNSQSSVKRFDSPQNSCVTQENMSPSKVVRAASVTSPTLASENVYESFDGQKEPLNPQEDVDDCNQNNFAAMDISNELQKLEGKNSSNDPDVRSRDFSQALQNEILSEEIVTENKVVLTNKVSKSAEYRKDYGGNSSDWGAMPALQSNLDSLKEKLKNASKGEGVNWKLKTLCEDSATFELKWTVYVYKCVLHVDVKSINATESIISFMPVGVNLRNSVINSVFDDIQDRGYKYFQYLVTDTVLPFSIFSEKLIDKLSDYSRISDTVETLMRDLLSFALGGECDIPYELDPLKITFKGINTNYECMYNMTFYVNLKTYPHEKIISEVQHVLCKDITKEVLIAVNNEQPGPNYLFRMMEAARGLKP